MLFRNWKNELFTVPNCLSLLRLLLIPVFLSLYSASASTSVNKTAFAVLAISFLTDFLDGIAARLLHQVTNVGKILDPLADKATQFALIICLAKRYRILLTLLPLFVLKESFQIIALLLALHSGKALPGALPAGKLCTAVLFSVLLALFVFPGISPSAVSALTAISFGALLFSLISYLSAYLGKQKKIQDI